MKKKKRGDGPWVEEVFPSWRYRPARDERKKAHDGLPLCMQPTFKPHWSCSSAAFCQMIQNRLGAVGKDGWMAGRRTDPPHMAPPRHVNASNLSLRCWHGSWRANGPHQKWEAEPNSSRRANSRWIVIIHRSFSKCIHTLPTLWPFYGRKPAGVRGGKKYWSQSEQGEVDFQNPPFRFALGSRTHRGLAMLAFRPAIDGTRFHCHSQATLFLWVGSVARKMALPSLQSSPACRNLGDSLEMPFLTYLHRRLRLRHLSSLMLCPSGSA